MRTYRSVPVLIAIMLCAISLHAQDKDALAKAKQEILDAETAFAKWPKTKALKRP